MCYRASRSFADLIGAELPRGSYHGRHGDHRLLFRTMAGAPANGAIGQHRRFPSSDERPARPVYGPALNRLRRLCGDFRTSEIELFAGDLDAMQIAASSRATATEARFMPRRLATAMPQARRRNHLRIRVINADAAS